MGCGASAAPAAKYSERKSVTATIEATKKGVFFGTRDKVIRLSGYP